MVAAFSLALAAFLATLAHTGLARAQRAGLTFEWEAPAGCPSREAVLGRLRKIVGKSLDRADRLRAEGRVEASNGRYRLTLKLRVGEADTERVIESNSCSDLAGAAAVALGLLVRDEIAAQDESSDDARTGDSSGSADQSAAAPAPAAEPDSRPTSATETTKPANPAVDPLAEFAPKASRAGSVRFLLRAPQVGLDVGPLPLANPTIGLSGGVGFQALELTFGARLGLGQTVWADGAPAHGAEIRRAALDARACYAPDVGFSIGPCLFVATDVISARGAGDEVSAQTQSAVIFAIGAAAQGRLRLADSLALVVSVGAQLETSRPNLVVDGLSDVARLARFALSTSMGVEWIL